MIGYIYIIKNKINKKVYIGQTTSTIKDRFKQHISSAYRIDRPTSKLYNAIKKYGINNFYIELIEETDTSKLNEREIYYISEYNSYINGYNSTLGGDGCTKLIWSESETFDIISNYLKGISLAKLANKYNVSQFSIKKY